MFAFSNCAITAMAMANACGDTTEACLDQIFAGNSGVALREGAPAIAGSQSGGLAWPCGALGSLAFPPAEVGENVRQEQVAERALSQIAEPLRQAIARHGASRVSVVLGSSTGGIQSSEAALRNLSSDGCLPDSYDFESQHLFHALSARIAAEFGIQGAAYVVSTACSSSAKALVSAARLIQNGLADAVLSGGVDSLCLTTLLGFSSLGVAAPAVCRPFASDRNGMNVAEGAAFLLLEGSRDADLFLLSAGESSDAHHMAQPHPEGIGAEQAMRQALRLAGVSSAAVSYVNAHGTGTVANDSAEALALGRVFGRSTSVSSTKALTGHQLGAAGAAEAIISCAAIGRGQVPGNGVAAASELPINVPSRTHSRAVSLAMSNSLAFGGSNASLLFGDRGAHAELGFSSPYKKNCPALSVGVATAILLDASAHPSEAARTLLGSRGYGRASPLCRQWVELFVRLRLACENSQCGLVFGSAYGEMSVTRVLLELQGERPPSSSPLRFQASVHKSAAGQIPIAAKHRGFSTAIAAGDQTPLMALTEAIAYLARSDEAEVLVLLADERAPEPFSRREHGPLAVGFRLTRGDQSVQENRLTVSTGCVFGEQPLSPRNKSPISDAAELAQAFFEKQPIELGAAGGPSGIRVRYQPVRAS